MLGGLRCTPASPTILPADMQNRALSILQETKYKGQGGGLLFGLSVFMGLLLPLVQIASADPEGVILLAGITFSSLLLIIRRSERLSRLKRALSDASPIHVISCAEAAAAAHRGSWLLRPFVKPGIAPSGTSFKSALYGARANFAGFEAALLGSASKPEAAWLTRLVFACGLALGVWTWLANQSLTGFFPLLILQMAEMGLEGDCSFELEMYLLRMLEE